MLIFAGLALSVPSGGPTGWETAVAARLTAHRSPIAVALLRVITHLCDPLSIALLCLFLILLPRSRRTIALPLVGACVLASGLNWLLKHLFLRPRPPKAGWLIAESGYSFPSGHSSTSAALCIALVFLAVGLVRRRHLRIALRALFSLLPVLIGISRVFLGVHYPGDVLAGWALGGAVGFAVCAGWTWLRPVLARRSFRRV